MSGDDPFEERLRETLRSGDSGDSGEPGERPTDVEGFLTDVHSGAHSRRRRRTAGIVIAAALVVIGGGAVVSTGILNDDETPTADRLSTGTVTTSAGTEGPTTTTPSSDTVSSAPPTVTPTPNNTQVLSLTSTGDDHQWVLTNTDSDSCSTTLCGSVFKTDSRGSWSSLGLFPYPLAGSVRQDTLVANLRFAEVGGKYDGWAFGPGLLSVHGVTDDSDSLDWHLVKQTTYGGYVTSLEAHGSTVYMIAETGEAHETLFVSPTSHDDWQKVPGGEIDGGAVDLNVSAGVVAFRSYANNRWNVTSSPADPETGEADNTWRTTQPCGGAGAEDLSSSSSVLWALCADGSVATTTVRGDSPPTWTTVVGPRTFDHPGHSLLAARDSDSALVAQDTGVSAVSGDGRVVPQTRDDFHQATLFGFTNDQLGFAIVDGVLYRTSDGGADWASEDVIPSG